MCLRTYYGRCLKLKIEEKTLHNWSPPKKVRENILKQIHSSLTDAHLGQQLLKKAGPVPKNQAALKPR